MIRIPIRPGVRLTFGGAPNPDAVKVTLAAGKPARVVRLVSKRGWMLLLVSYDWRKPTPTPEERLMSTPPTPDLPAEAAAPVSPDDIPTGITRLTYRTAQALGDAGLPILSQNQTAVFLAHYWPAIEQHFRNVLANEIGATSQRLLDDIPESERSSRDWDQHEEWLEAASTIRPAAAPTATTTPEEH